ncbi:MAG: hypothetical protein K9L17_14365 [Clostridiales bacterium]|nr:hypothetical protein [Clostridiales bacterium]
MGYFILFAILALWVLIDAAKRKNNFIGWPIGTILIGPIILPFYIAFRNLKEGEIREGGKAWNVLKNFAIFWTILAIVQEITIILMMPSVVDQSMSEAEQAGAALGSTFAALIIPVVWFIGMVFALILGFFLKKSSIVEKGPTGALSNSSI